VLGECRPAHDLARFAFGDEDRVAIAVCFDDPPAVGHGTWLGLEGGGTREDALIVDLRDRDRVFDPRGPDFHRAAFLLVMGVPHEKRRSSVRRAAWDRRRCHEHRVPEEGTNGKERLGDMKSVQNLQFPDGFSIFCRPQYAGMHRRSCRLCMIDPSSAIYPH
jgi:hypothetical protein